MVSVLHPDESTLSCCWDPRNMMQKCRNKLRAAQGSRFESGLQASSPTATMIPIKAKVNPQMLCNFMRFFYWVKTENSWRLVWFYEAPLKMLLLNSGQVKGKQFYCLCSSSVFVLDTGSTIASISGWFYGDFKMQWSCHWCLMVTKTSGNLAARQTRVSSESTVTATPAPADCSGRVRKYSICSFSGLRTELSFGANYEISFVLEHNPRTRNISNSRI